jgi:energy-coupling factor transporter ATP-binding protein EcfA2
MDTITWNMRHGLPSQKYLEFVARYLLHWETERPLVDPFAPDVPVDKAEGVYIVREDVENEIGQSATKIILGARGSGKTTLFRRLPALLHNQALVIQLPLAQVGASVPEQDLMEGTVSLLTVDLLARHIFDTYWEDLVRDPTKRARFLPQLRRDQWWMTTLRRFYHRYRPLRPQIPEEFELMTWVNALPQSGPSNSYTPEDAVRELIRLVTFQQERYGAPLSQTYTQIQVLIDGTERPSNLAIARLIQDAQRLYDLYLDRVCFKLFADATWQNQIEGMDCVRQGRVAVYHLPQWRAEELRQILLRRLAAWMPGEFADTSIQTDYDWSKHVPDTHLKPAAQSHFVQIVVEGALRTYDEKDGLDAPIHVLRLARGLVAACAGCWEEQGYVPPLGVDQIGELVDLYWKAG